MTKLDAVDGGLKLVSEDLLHLHYALQLADGHLNMNALRTLLSELEKIRNQVETLNTTVAQIARNVSHNQEYKSITLSPLDYSRLGMY